MKTYYNIQKIGNGLLLMALSVNAYSQFEHLVELNPQRSVMYAKYLKENTPTDIYIYVQSEEYTSNNNRWIHGNPNTQKHLLNINSETGTIISSTPFSMPYATNSYFHAFGNTMAGFRGEVSTKERPDMTLSNGIVLSGYSNCTRLVLGLIDTVTKVPLFYKEPNCDFERGFEMTYVNGKFYVVYQSKDPIHGGNAKLSMLELDQNLQLIQKHNFNINPFQVDIAPDGSGFYVFEETRPTQIEVDPSSGNRYENSQYYFQLKKLAFDGIITNLGAEFLADDITPGTGVSITDMVTDGINTYLHLDYYDNITQNQIRKYDSSGTLIGIHNVGSELAFWKPMLGGLFYIGHQKHYDQTLPHPIKIMGFDEYFVNTGAMDVGYTSVTISDVAIDENNLIFTAIGSTNMHYSDTATRHNDKLYLYQNSLLNVMVPADGNSIENDSFYFPNPNNRSFAYLKFNSINTELTGNLTIQFVDIKGKKFEAKYSILEKNLIQIETSEIPTGTYVGNVEMNGVVISSGKLVIEK